MLEGHEHRFLPLPKDSSVLRILELPAQPADLGFVVGESGRDLLPVYAWLRADYVDYLRQRVAAGSDPDAED
jgi:hypothetical protein